MRCNRVTVFVGFLGVMTAAAFAHATAIDITDGGFESATVTGNGWQAADVAGAGVPGWIGDGTAGVQFGGTGTINDLTAHAGNYWAGINNDTNVTNPSLNSLSQLLKTSSSALSVNAGDQINVSLYESLRTMWVGQTDSTNYPSINLRVGIRAGSATGTLLDSQTFTSSDLTAGYWTARNYKYTATADAVGKNLYLELKNTTPFVNYSIRQVNVDDVTATYTAVVTPEPSTCAMVLIGAFGLLAYAWRKRN